MEARSLAHIASSLGRAVSTWHDRLPDWQYAGGKRRTRHGIGKLRRKAQEFEGYLAQGRESKTLRAGVLVAGTAAMSLVRIVALTALAPLGAAACTGSESNSEDTLVTQSLRLAFAADEVEVVGVTVRADTGERYLLEANRGLYKIDADGAILPVLALEDFPSSDIAPASGFTDIVHLEGARFALTAMNDGFLLDLDTMTMQRHFCYLPEDLPLEDVYQLTESVTYDPLSQLIFAQPQTVSMQDDSVVASSLGNFAGDSGQDLQWIDMGQLDYLAGGMAVTGPQELSLGRGSALDRFDLGGGVLSGSLELSRFGVKNISGLAVDTSADALLIIDADDDTLVELPLAVLRDGFANR